MSGLSGSGVGAEMGVGIVTEDGVEVGESSRTPRQETSNNTIPRQNRAMAS